MEKRGVIEPGRTPPEEAGDKRASSLEDHVTTRAAAEAADACAAKPPAEPKPPPKH